MKRMFHNKFEEQIWLLLEFISRQPVFCGQRATWTWIRPPSLDLSIVHPSSSFDPPSNHCPV